VRLSTARARPLVADVILPTNTVCVDVGITGCVPLLAMCEVRGLLANSGKRVTSSSIPHPNNEYRESSAADFPLAEDCASSKTCRLCCKDQSRELHYFIHWLFIFVILQYCLVNKRQLKTNSHSK